MQQTEFEDQFELFAHLRKNVQPVEIFLTNDEQLPQNICQSIEKAEEEREQDVVNFQG